MEKVAVFILLSLMVTLLFTGSDACDGAPSMSAVAACKQAATGPAMSKLCADTLGTSPEAQEVTSYVVAAANAATQSYAASKEAVGKVLQNPLAPDDIRLPCLICANKYDDASMLVASMADDVQHCSLTDIRADTLTAVAAVDDCATAVFPGGITSPLYTMAIADRDRSVLVLRLAMLLVPTLQHF
ncbi:hypothetical protein E2562_038319 [Oryza meyeriana var. granulata]|uniref:Pectinesterase inhibitor domain-containing protein n=1 Tax=Oryza meyeriana var. granulata TaxID=110450 RepID=A0A6G1CM12_9ORYZ|nr:hypothetical protein E2562_038319 [Oryza meyeriana var. granulata]